MCNLYSMTKERAAIVALTRAMTDRNGNLPPMPGIFPNYPAPIVRSGNGDRVMALTRWGMPTPKLKPNKDGVARDSGVTKSAT